MISKYSVLLVVACLLLVLCLLPRHSFAEIGPVFPDLDIPKERAVDIESLTKHAEDMVKSGFFHKAKELISEAKDFGRPSLAMLQVIGMLCQFVPSKENSLWATKFFMTYSDEEKMEWDSELLSLNLRILLINEDYASANQLCHLISVTCRMPGKNAQEYLGAMIEPLKWYMKSFGAPLLYSEAFINDIFQPWEEVSKRYMFDGKALLEKDLVLEAIVAFRRAKIVSVDKRAASLELAKCWMIVEDFDNAVEEAILAGDIEGASKILEAARNKKNILEKSLPNFHPSKVSRVSGSLNTINLHHIVATEKYIGGLSPMRSLFILDSKTKKVVFQYTHHNDRIVEGKIAPVKHTRLSLEQYSIEGDNIILHLYDTAFEEPRGTLMVFNIPTKKLLLEKYLHLSHRTFASVYLVDNYVFTIQSKGTRPWCSIFNINTGKEIFRRTGFEDIISTPFVKDNKATFTIDTLGFGKLICVDLKAGKILWSKKFDYQRVAEHCETMLGLSGDNAKRIDLPTCGEIIDETTWIPTYNRKENTVEITGFDCNTGEIQKHIPLEMPAGAGLKVSKNHILFHDAQGFLSVFSKDGKQLWRKQFNVMNFFFSMTDEFIIFPDSEGSRILATKTGKSIVFSNSIPESAAIGEKIISPELILDLSVDMNLVANYLAKIFAHATELDVDFNRDEIGKANGYSVDSEGERFLKEFEAREPGISEVILAKLNLTKNSVYSHCKDYMHEYIKAEAYDEDNIRAAFKKYCPGLKLNWYKQMGSIGTCDGDIITNVDINSSTLVCSDMNGNEKWAGQLNIGQEHRVFTTPNAVFYFYPIKENDVPTNLYCRSKLDGKILWQKNYPWILNVRQGKFHSGKIYFFSKLCQQGQKYACTIRCVDATNGEFLWKFTPEGPYAPFFFSHHLMAIDDTGLYFGSTDASVYKLNLDTGKVIWSSGSVKRDKSGEHDCVFATIVLKNGYLYTHASDLHVYCMDPVTGKKRWVGEVPESILNDPKFNSDLQKSFFVPDPIVITDKVLVAEIEYASQRSLIAYDTQTGKFLWEYKGNFYLIPTMLGDGKSDSIYVPVFSTGLEKISLTTGKLINHIPIPCQFGYIFGDTIILDAAGYVFSFSIIREEKDEGEKQPK